MADLNVNLTITGEVEKLHVGPDDAVLFKIIADHPLTAETMNHLVETVRKQFVDVEWVDRILFFDGKMLEVSVIKNGRT